MAAAVAVAAEHFFHFGTDRFGRGKQDCRIEVALQRDFMADLLPRDADVHGPVQADRIAAGVGNAFDPQSAALGEHDGRDAHAIFFLDQTIHDAMRVGQRKFVERRMRQYPAPGIEDHHGLRTCFDLRIQVSDHRLGGHFENVVHQLRLVVHQGLHLGVIVAAAAFDHVAGQRERAAGKTDQRHATVQRLADLRHGVGDVFQILADIRHTQRLDVRFRLQRALELRAFAIGKIQTQPHRIRHGKDVREQDRRVQRETVQRLQRHFGSVVRALAQAEKAAGAFARFAVLRQETTGLAHHPHWRVVGRLAQQGAQEGVVFQFEVHV